MTKFFVLTIGIIWACLLFISWGQADDLAPAANPSPGVDVSAQR